MDKPIVSDSNMSLDSLEEDFNKKTSLKDAISDDNVETILVPFYEKDVLIKVPKDQIRKTKQEKAKYAEKQKKDNQITSSYLVNKDLQRSKRTTYLEMFRKQFVQGHNEKAKTETDIRSLSPEFGDTERESIAEDQTNPGEEFYNTESYNEIYYEKLLQQQMEDLEDSSEEGILFNDDEGNKSPYDNLRSVSEVSPPRRRSRRATVLPAENVKLGGLGPDVELIKPRLERARSLQRYSEKVRMANRLRIYKKSIQDDDQKKQEREAIAKRQSARRQSARDRSEENASYLVNKCSEEKSSQLTNKIYDSKAKSANALKSKERHAWKEEILSKVKSAKGRDLPVERNRSASRDLRSRNPKGDKKETDDADVKVRVKSSGRKSRIHTEIKPENSEVPPVQISFLVNFGGVRPSTALRSLEEKHRHYQEQVKAYMEADK
ncbi:hypothetical protein MSG28_005039 [Choristoneura fumiferana]|uniref:Uncharacterized protein n=2 Tax=Choristoneura fumiferana TaxID=7141 RepID=A0ACC0JPL0_CHOFU|nr:hypothetical protein MSG28_005039 [Choristoneura fumiferana]